MGKGASAGTPTPREEETGCVIRRARRCYQRRRRELRPLVKEAPSPTRVQHVRPTRRTPFPTVAFARAARVPRREPRPILPTPTRPHLHAHALPERVSSPDPTKADSPTKRPIRHASATRASRRNSLLITRTVERAPPVHGCALLPHLRRLLGRAVAIGYVAITGGDPNLLYYGFDSGGYLCGVKNELWARRGR